MNNLEAMQQILQTIEEYKKIVIVRHTRPDGDCVGSTLALKDILKKTYPDKEVKVISNDFAPYLYFLGNEDEQEHADYYKDALGIALDVSVKERISNNYIENCEKIIKIDHHRITEPFGDICWIEENISSVCEMITKLYYNFKEKLILSAKAAECLYTGMVTDTGRFKFSSCNSETFRMAGLLLDFNLNVEAIYANLYLKEFVTYKLQSEVYRKAKITKDGVVYIYISKKLQKKYHLTENDASAMISTIESIKGSIVWIAFIDNNDKSIRVRFRSRFMNIVDIAEKYHGGGHDKAAGAVIHSKREMLSIINDANEAIKKYKENNKGWL